jgi:hypothetical protein
MTRSTITALSFALIVGLAGCGSAETGSRLATTVTATSEHVEGAIGKTSSLAPYTITVHTITDPWDDPEFGGGSDGTRFVIADITIANTGGTTQTISNPCFTVSDTDSRQYKAVLGGGDNPPLDGTVDVDGELRGDVAFQVPEDVELAEMRLAAQCNTMKNRDTLGIALNAGNDMPDTDVSAPTETAPPVPSEDAPATSSVDARLVKIATTIGCTEPALDASAPDDTGIEQYATCDRDGARVQLYIIDDREALEAEVAQYGVDLGTTSVFVGDSLMVTPDDTTVLGEISDALR